MSAAAQGLFIDVRVTHRLAVAFQFLDIFTGVPVRSPLRVAVEEFHWRAFHSEADATYRFLRSNGPIPAGNFQVSVNSTHGDYENWLPITASLPVVIGHPPPVVRSDYLRQVALWPTRKAALAQGETAAVGHIRSAGATPVAGVRVHLYAAPGPSPATPFAVANAAGEFLFRLPQLRHSMVGGAAVSTASLNVEMRTPGGATVSSVVPSLITVNLGVTSLVEFNVP